jgi:hypothetical protein
MTSVDSNGGMRSWAPIIGRWSVESETLRYLGPQADAGVPYGICLTNADLTDGTIHTVVRFSQGSEGGRVLLGYRSPTERYLMVGLGGWRRAYTIGEFDPAFGWKGLAVAGSADNLAPDHLYTIKVTMTGQRIALSVDDVRVLEHVLEKPLTGGQVGLFAWGDQVVEFRSFVLERQPGTVFVVMQFSEPYKQLYDDVIKPVTATFGLRAYHVGDVFGPGLILGDVAQGIVDAKVIVAEITPPNQNVFYELGYAHALAKPTILLAERGKQLPFDISGYRVLFYENTIAGKSHVEDGLKKHLAAILRE